MWGVNSRDEIYRLKKDKKWIKIPGSLKHVTEGELGVWGVNKFDDIYFSADRSTWKHIPGKLKQIDSGFGNIVYGVNSNDDIFCRIGEINKRSNNFINNL